MPFLKLSKVDSLLKTRLGENYRKYFNNSIWFSLEKLIRMVINVFVGAWVARYLEPSGFGSLSFVISLVLITGIFCQLGLDNIVVRELVKTPNNVSDILATAFWLKIMGGLLMFVILTTVWQFLNTSNTESVMLAWLAAGVFFQAFNVIEMHFRALLQAKLVAYTQIGQMLVTTIAKIVLLIIGADIQWFAMANGLEFLAQAVLLLYFHRNYKQVLLFSKFNKNQAKVMLKESMPLALAGLSVIMYMRVDQVMIQQMTNTTEAGYYAAAVRLSEVWYFIPMAIITALFPNIIRSKMENHALYHRRLVLLLRLLVFIALFVAIVTYLLAPYIIAILFGDSYEKSVNILQIHIWAGVFIVFGLVLSQREMAEKLNGIIFFRSFLGLSCNLVLNYILIPRYFALGAAVATLISQFICVIPVNIFWKKSWYNLTVMRDALFFTANKQAGSER